MRWSSINRNTLFIILEGIAAAVVLNLFNPFTQMFAKRMGAVDTHIALINSLPPLVAIMVLIPFGLIIERIRNKKLVTCVLIAANSLFYAAIAFTPGLPHRVRLVTYVILIGVMNWPGSLYTTTWQSFFSYNFKGREASLIYSQRSKYSAFFGFLTVLATGFIISSIPKSDEERIFIYQLFYAACFLICIIQVVFLSRVRQADNTLDPKDNASEKRYKVQDFLEVFYNKPFIIFCACTFVFHVAWQMGWPLFFIYNADYIKVNEFQLGMISVASGVASFLSYSLWNRLADKKGNSFAIIIGAVGLALNPFLYMRILEFHWIIIINAVVGAAASGFSFTLFCDLMEILPKDKKTVYISVYNTFINISGFASPLVGVWINRHTGIFKAFLIIGILRTIGVLLFALRWYTGEKTRRIKLAKSGACERSC